MNTVPRFVSPGEITDQDLTVGEMRAFMRESREDMRWLREELAPAIVDLRAAVASIRSHQVDIDKRVTAIEAAIAKKPRTRKRK